MLAKGYILPLLRPFSRVWIQSLDRPEARGPNDHHFGLDRLSVVNTSLEEGSL